MKNSLKQTGDMNLGLVLFWLARNEVMNRCIAKAHGTRLPSGGSVRRSASATGAEVLSLGSF